MTASLLMWLGVSIFIHGDARIFGVLSVAATRPKRHNLLINHPHLECRGGYASTVIESDAEEDYDVDLDSSEELDESDEIPKKPDAKLSASTLRATEKSKAKKAASGRQAVNSRLTEAGKIPAKQKQLKLPYILRASTNPFTVFAMTKAYFASLFNLEYAKKDLSQDLRSALEEKAKKFGGGGAKGKRKMRPGQAKTLSDLPQLNT